MRKFILSTLRILLPFLCIIVLPGLTLADVVTVAAIDASAGEPSNIGKFRITKSPMTLWPVAVSFTMSGTAVNGTDYQTITSPVVIPAWATSVDITLTPKEDTLFELNESATLTIQSSALVTPGTPKSATVTIADNDFFIIKPTVTVSAIDATAKETGGDTGRYRITRGGGILSSPLTVNFSMGGTAVNGTDYNTISGPVTIPAWATSVDITLTPKTDIFFEGNETAILTLSPSTAYNIGSPSSATVTIAGQLLVIKPTVKVEAIDATAKETGGDTGRFRITRGGGILTVPLTVNFSMGGSAINGNDYQTISGPVTIPALATSVDITLTPKTDSIFEGDETAILSLSPSTAYNIGSPSSATVTIAGQLLLIKPTVKVEAIDATAKETGGDTGRFRITRGGGILTVPLTVNFSMGGTAVNGTDYNTISGPVTIPALATSVDITLTPKTDSIFEGDETAILSLSPSTAYNIGSPSSATVTIAGQLLLIKPTVKVEAIDATAKETGGDTGRFRITRGGGILTLPLTVNFSMDGSAINGTDYNTISGPVTIPALATSVDITLTPKTDSIFEGDETAILSLSPSTAYNIGSPSSATVTIAGQLLLIKPTVKVEAIDATAKETGGDTGRFRITRGGGILTLPLTVNFSMGGSAVNGTDYQTISSPVTIPSGSTSLDLTLKVKDDSIYEGDESATLKILPNTAYTIGSAGSATVKIEDNDPAPKPVLSVTAVAATASEPSGSAKYRISRSGNTSSSLSVYFSMSGSAVNGSDYQTISSPVTIPSGSTSLDLTLKVKDDSIYEGDESATLKILSNTAYTIGSAGSATVKIEDNDPAPKPVLSVTAVAATASEPSGSAKYRISRSGNTSSSLSVYFSMSGSAVNGSDYQTISSPVTIPSGSTSLDLTLKVKDDSIYEGDESATLKILPNTAYTIGSAGSATVSVKDNDEPSVLERPGNVSASDGAFHKKIQVEWNHAAGALSYEVWRNTINDTDTAQQIAESVTGTLFVDRSVSPETVYTYWVKAKNADGVSEFSTPDVGHCLPYVPMPWLPLLLED